MGNLRLGDWVVEIPGHTPTPGYTRTADILGTTYQTVILPDGKEWMAENLAWVPSSIPPNGVGSSWWGSGASDDGDGRYYNYSYYPDHDVIAKALLAEGSSWRGPTYNDAMALSAALTAAVGAGNAGNALKATSEWPSGGGTDLYGFNAKPAGRGIASWGWTWERKTDRLWIDVFKDPNGASNTVYAMRIDDEVGTFKPYSSDDSGMYRCRVSVRLVRDGTPTPTPPTYRSGTHDLLILPSGQAETTESLAQRVDVRLRTFFGEHWLNPELGVPWFRDFLVKSPDLAACRQILHDVIRGVRGVRTINALTLSLSKGPRILSITFAVNGTDPFTSTIPV